MRWLAGSVPSGMALVLPVATPNGAPPLAPKREAAPPSRYPEPPAGDSSWLGLELSHRRSPPLGQWRPSPGRFPRPGRLSLDCSHKSMSLVARKRGPLPSAKPARLRPRNAGRAVQARRGLRALLLPSRRLAHILLLWALEVKEILPEVVS